MIFWLQLEIGERRGLGLHNGREEYERVSNKRVAGRGETAALLVLAPHEGNSYVLYTTYPHMACNGCLQTSSNEFESVSRYGNQTQTPRGDDCIVTRTTAVRWAVAGFPRTPVRKI